MNQDEIRAHLAELEAEQQEALAIYNELLPKEERCPGCGAIKPFSRPTYESNSYVGMGRIEVGEWLEWRCIRCDFIIRGPTYRQLLEGKK